MIVQPKISLHPFDARTDKVGFLRDGKQCLIFVSNDSTSNFLCTFPSDTFLEAKRYQDFHQTFSHRHFYRTKWDKLFVKKTVFCHFLSVLLRIISFVHVHSLFHPLECWKMQKTASNLVSYFLSTEPKVQNLVIFSICHLSLKRTLHKYLITSYQF